METVAYLQVVPGSFTPYPCNCQPDTGGNHLPDCPFSVFSNTEIMPYNWPPSPKFRPQSQGEQCGRCWQNHTPGFVCACLCHETDEERDIRLHPDNGDDLNAPQTT